MNRLASFSISGSRRSNALWAPVAAACIATTAVPAAAQAPRSLPEGTPSADARLAAPRTLDGYHPCHPVASVPEWEGRRAAIRRRVAIAAGLWPMPDRPELAPVIHGTIDQGDYTVEKVFFESFPGHFVTGNLYRPAGASRAGSDAASRRPGVLCPHGHWPKGRFMDAGEAEAARQIAEGAERFVNGGRSVLQARCVGLARLGCVVFHYDMLGYADSVQFPEHRHGPLDALDGREPGGWGFGGFAATAHLQSHFGLQTFNSIRALDFLCGLPDVDTARIAVTGASGGGTQTMMLTALDDRVKAAFPCVMVSTAMQGGCTCENAALLRIGQGNIDIAAATAPRPLGLTAADDWTKELEQKGYPDLVGLYRMLGVPDAVEAHFDIRFKHNYNAVSRSHCYRFLDRHFALHLPAPGDERDFDLLDQTRLTVWDDAHPAPSGDAVGDAHEKGLCRTWTEDAARKIAPLVAAADSRTLAAARETLGGAFETIFGRGLPAADAVAFETASVAEASPAGFETGVVVNTTHDERIPVVVLRPREWRGGVVIWAHSAGKAGLFDEGAVSAGRPNRAVQAVLDRGLAVVAADLFGQGEATGDGRPVLENPRVQYPGPTDTAADRWRLDPCYTYGYNDSVYARRVHDLLTLVAFVRGDRDHPARSVTLVGQAGAGHWVAGALAAARPWETPAGQGVDKAIIETDGFRFDAIPSVWHADFLPGAVKYGDLPGLLALAAPTRLLLDDPDPVVRRQAAANYRSAGVPGAVTTRDIAAFDPDRGPDWLEFVTDAIRR
jgi:hypothetical protein